MGPVPSQVARELCPPSLTMCTFAPYPCEEAAEQAALVAEEEADAEEIGEEDSLDAENIWYLNQPLPQKKVEILAE